MDRLNTAAGAGMVATAFVIWFAMKWINHRRHFRKIPGPPSSLLFGNIKQYLELAALFPPQFHWGEHMSLLADMHGLTDEKVIRIDLWPLMPPFILLRDPYVASAMAKKDYPKHPFSLKILRTGLGSRSFTTLGGREWRLIRGTFISAFSISYLTNAAPTIIEPMQIFNKRLAQCAQSGEKFKLENFAQDLAFDVISQIVLDKNFHCQKQNPRPPIEYHLTRLMHSLSHSNNPFNRLLVAIPQWYHSRKLKSLISHELRERFKTYDKESSSKRGQGAAIDWMLNAKGREELTPELLATAVDSVQTLIVGGHDSTAGSFSHLVAYMVRNPQWAERCRKEHDEVFGSDTAIVADTLRRDPKLLNQLPITTACIKEALRKSPQGIFPRKSFSEEETMVVDGKTIPLGHGAAIGIAHSYIMRQEKHYPDGWTYNPGRWLVEKDKKPPPESFRAFERNSIRNCPGEQLAMLQLRMLMVFVMRDFEFELAYEPTDPKAPEEFGGYVFQRVDISFKPSLGLPVRVKQRTASH